MKLHMNRTTMGPSILALLSISSLLFLVHAQFPFGGNANAGTATDPVPILLQSPTALSACYSFNGSFNNAANPQWGGVGEPLLRPEGSSYAGNDWAQFPGGPNPRSISNVLSHETCADAARNAEPCYNDWFWVWGQYLDHDLTHVPTFGRPSVFTNIAVNTTTDLTINVSPNDPFLAGRTLPLTRSLTTPNDPTEQINLATSFLDSSQLYGSTIEKADSIRTFRNGMLKSTLDGFMPVLSSRLNFDMTNVPTFDELGSPANKDQFLCADMRCNQHAPMASLQTMYIREHNRIALALSQANHPGYNTDEAIYQAARACVIAMNQAITYNEFLPLLLGRFNLSPYSGYKPEVRPTVSNAFSTAGFRAIHSMIGCDFKEMTSSGQTLRSVAFSNSFFDSTWIRNLPAQPNRQNREANAYQTIMNALGLNPSTHFDHKVSPILRSVLFAGNTATRRPDVAFDVVSSDIQRGRDHGLLSYREMRQKMGWKDINKMEDLTLQLERVNILKSIYGTDVDNIDLVVGLLTEDPLDGALTGPVTTSIIQDQFQRTRDGDRCYFENQFQGALLNAFRNTKLKHLVDRNFNTPANPFASETVQGTLPVRRPAPTIPTPPSPPRPGVAVPITQPIPPPVTTVPINTPVGDLSLGVPVTTRSTLSTSSSDQLPHQVLNPVVTLQDLRSNISAELVDELSDPLPPTSDRGGRPTNSNRAHRRYRDDEDTTDDHKMPYDPSRRDGNRYIVDSNEDRRQFERDPQGHANRRYRNGQSHFDNGRGTRQALPFDDIIGWECYGENCFAVALESDPVIMDDPEVIEFIRQYREFKRQRQQQDATTMKPAVITPAVTTEPTIGPDGVVSNLSTGDVAGLTAEITPGTVDTSTFALNNAFIRNNGFNTMLFSQPNTMATLAQLSGPRHFNTMQASNARPINIPLNTPMTSVVRLTNGRNALSPLDDILQTDQRRQLAATVTPQQTAENIFLTPSCRSRV